MKTRRIDFNFKPLILRKAMVVENSVAGNQTYDSDFDVYTPDYRITPLTILPQISVVDRDKIIPDGLANSMLTNIKWYEIVNSQKTLIQKTTKEYEILTSGEKAGRIIVKKNSVPKSPITLVFSAELVDPRTSEVFSINDSFQIRCSNETNKVRIELDSPSQSLYNPISDVEEQKIVASVWIGDKKMSADDNRIEYSWEVVGEDGYWHLVGSDSVMDYDVTSTNNIAVVNKKKMGNEMYLRCRIKYDANGNPSSKQLTEFSPSAMTSFFRRIPKYEFEIEGVPSNIPSDAKTVSPEASVTFSDGVYANPFTELLALWYMATNVSVGNPQYELLAHGKNPIIPTQKMDRKFGGILALDVQDRGYFGALCDQDGIILCDNDGSVILIH